jgi:hypothetical protein
MTKLPGVGAFAVAVSVVILTACSGSGSSGGSGDDGGSAGSGGKDRGRSDVNAKAYDPALRSMKIGSCLNTAHSKAGPLLGKATVVDCTKAHTYEIYAHVTSKPAPSYPEDTLPQAASDYCSKKFRAYTGAGAGGSVLFAAYAIYPEAKDWKAGNRVTTCVIVPPVDAPPTTTFTTSAKRSTKHER